MAGWEGGSIEGLHFPVELLVKVISQELDRPLIDRRVHESRTCTSLKTRILGLVVPPKAVIHPAADYTARAYLSTVEGHVIVQAHFDEGRNITVLNIVRGLGYALQNGLPVTAVAEIEVPFKSSGLLMKVSYFTAQRNGTGKYAVHGIRTCTLSVVSRRAKDNIRFLCKLGPVSAIGIHGVIQVPWDVGPASCSLK